MTTGDPPPLDWGPWERFIDPPTRGGRQRELRGICCAVLGAGHPLVAALDTGLAEAARQWKSIAFEKRRDLMKLGTALWRLPPERR